MPQFYTEEEAIASVKKLIAKKMMHFARRSVHEALREYPDSKQIRFLNAHIASELRDCNAAIAILEKLNKEDPDRSEEHTSELQSRRNLVCRLLLEKKKQQHRTQ